MQKTLRKYHWSWYSSLRWFTQQPGLEELSLFMSPAPNWNPCSLLSKMIRTVYPNMVYVASKIQKSHYASFFVVDSTKYSNLPLHMRTSLMAQRLKRPPPMRETRVRSLGQEDPLEKEMAIHSSILAWRILWTENPSRLQSTGSQRVGHDWVTSPSPRQVYFKQAPENGTSLHWCDRCLEFLSTYHITF